MSDAQRNNTTFLNRPRAYSTDILTIKMLTRGQFAHLKHQIFLKNRTNEWKNGYQQFWSILNFNLYPVAVLKFKTWTYDLREQN